MEKDILTSPVKEKSSFSPIGGIKRMDKEKCPELRATLVGDETYYFCTLTEKICIREYGYECEEYDEWLRSEENVAT